jgi:hypothetical protein
VGRHRATRGLTAHGLPMARIVYDVDGLSGQNARLAHDVTYVVWSPEGAYTYSLNCPSAAAAATDALADDMVASVRLAHLAPAKP